MARMQDQTERKFINIQTDAPRKKTRWSQPKHQIKPVKIDGLPIPTADKDKDDALEEVCTESYNQLTMAKRLLAEDVSDDAARKRTIDCLDNGIKFINDFKKKYKVGSYSSEVNEPTTSSVARIQKINPDWQFVDSYREEKGKDMDWNNCFELAKEKGLFKKYTKIDSAKAAYFRAKK